MNTKLKTKTLMLSVLLTAHVSTAAEPPVRASQNNHVVTIDNGRVKGVFRLVDGRVQQEFYASLGDQWAPVARSWPALEQDKGGSAGPHEIPPSPLYDSSLDPANRLLATEIVQEIRLERHNSDGAKILLRGIRSGAEVEETVELRRGDSFFHIEAKAKLSESKPQLEYLLLPFEFQAEGKPDATHAPTFKPTEDSVIGDRVFFAPAVCVQKGGLCAALIPDVEMINRNVVYARGARQHPDSDSFRVPVKPEDVSMPTALDLMQPSPSSGHAILAYGMMDYIVHQHVWFEHKNVPGTMVRELSTNSVRIGMDLLVQANAPQYRGYQAVAAHQWRRFGSKWFDRPRPQAMPYADYAEAFYPANFVYQGYDVVNNQSIKQRHLPGHDMDAWQQWEEAGTPVGGFRLHAPQWYNLIADLAWWNNVCDATGLYFWGQRLGKQEWVDRARRMVNLALSAPQDQGIFPGVYDLGAHRWRDGLWGPPLNGYDPNRRDPYWNSANPAYQTAAASVTAGYLMQYRKTCETNELILPYVRRYGDFLIAHIQTNGCVPAWVDSQLRPLPSMKWNADGGAHVWVLSELYLATGEKKYLEAARQIAQTLMDEVLPQQRWADFEAFYSCAVKPETFFDERTGQWPCNTMSVSWAMQGFLSLHDATGEEKYLKAAEATADYASLFQAIWAPHYVITAYPFGGMSSQHGDSEWLDQRAHRFADPFVRIGLLTGRQDLVERGIAAARSCLTLGNHPRHLANGIYNYPDFPLGLGPENVDHEGFPQRPLASGPSWNTVGGLAGVAHVLRQLGGAYVDCSNGLAVGTDGVKVAKYKRVGRTLQIELEDQLADLQLPYDQTYSTTMQVTGLSESNAPDRLKISWAAPITGTGRTTAKGGDIKIGDHSENRQVNLQILPNGRVIVTP